MSDKLNNPTLETETILEVKNLKKYFPIEKDLFGRPTKYLKAVENVSFKLNKGTTIGVVGESGCGKTTLGRTILKLYESNGGQIIFEGKDITIIS
jgi:ABC-type oligopeptide transport system ATPase subunit